MHRFYIPDSDFDSKELILKDKREFHHLKNVLRLRKNDAVEVFNGRGREASGRILALDSKHALIEIQSVKCTPAKIPNLILACAIPKKGKFEFIVEKATELGVDRIIPLTTQRADVKVNPQGASRKSERFELAAVSAAKQCQRAVVPVIYPVTSFQGCLKMLAEIPQISILIASLLGSPKNCLRVFEELPSPAALAFLIGPEGDFTEEEYAEADKSGCIPVSLGAHILRVETAAMCVAAAANLFYRHD